MLENPHGARPEYYLEATVRRLLARPEKRARTAVSPAHTPEEETRHSKKHKSRVGPASVVSKGSYAGRPPPLPAGPAPSGSKTRPPPVEPASSEYKPEGTPDSDSARGARHSAKTRSKSKKSKTPATHTSVDKGKAPEPRKASVEEVPQPANAALSEKPPRKTPRPRQTQQKIHERLQSDWAARVSALPANFRGQGPAPPFAARQIKALRVAEEVVVSSFLTLLIM